MALPLMPKATAVWLVENTALAFDQIADFCGMHALEIQSIADGEVAQGIVGLDPVANGQVTQEEIDRCMVDATARLAIIEPAESETPKRRRGPRYTPISKRQDKPDAIAWLLRNHPELSDAQVMKLVGTTKPTINAVRDRTHWNSSSITPRDPVALGLSTQVELDAVVQKAAEREHRKLEREEKERAKKAEKTLKEPLAGAAISEAPTASPGTIGAAVEKAQIETTTPSADDPEPAASS